MLALFPLARHFALNCLAPLGALVEEIASLDACGRVLGEYVLIKRGGRGENFGQAVTKFLERHRNTYGEGSMKPKHHWLLHLPSQLRKDGFLVDTFPLERLHRKVKKYAENCRASGHYERGVIANCLLAHARAFEETDVRDGLLPPICSWGELGVEGLASKEARLAQIGLVVGDLVFLEGHQLVQIHLCVSRGGKLGVVAAPLSLQSRTSQSSWRN